MKLRKRVNITGLIGQFKTGSVSMRRRLFLYVIATIFLILALILLLLNVFGVLNLSNTQVNNILDVQLTNYSSSVEHDYDKLAAHAISFADQLEKSIQNYLTSNNLAFEELRNNNEAVTELQNKLYDIVYLNMQIAPSSGAFYILDTTVNSHTDTPLFNGIYLKYINLHSENTVNNQFSLYRGSVTTGKQHGITFHSGWQNEMKTDFFTNCNEIFTENVHYQLSSAMMIPDTWESARYIYVPIRNLKGGIWGVCGFEITDLYFQLTYKTKETQLGNIIYALLDHNSGKYTGQFSSNRYSTNSQTDNILKLTEKKKLCSFDFGSDTCIGKTNTICLGGNTFITAAMIPQAQYNSYIKKGQLQMTVIFLIVALFSSIYCVFISKKYVAPILKSFEQVKSQMDYGSQLNIREIDDLFAFLEEKDNQYELRLQELEQAKQAAEEETQKAKNAYEKAMAEYELAQSEIQTLADEQKSDIVLKDYDYFICNLSTLTPAEHRVYELYLAGKNAKQITEILDISENTLKYHNKNIYSKLGISSRKQLLRYATLKQHQDKNQNV
mgnify:FL=1